MQGCVSTRDPFPTVPRRLSLPSDVPNLARARSPPTDPSPPTPSRLRSHPDILSGGISYDNKFNVSSKVSGQNVKADVVFKGKDATGSATASYAIDKDFTADLTLNEKGDVKTVLAHAGLVDGLKTTVTAEPMKLAKTLKIANAYRHGALGVKADVAGALGEAPKVDASALVGVGDSSVVGAEATFNKGGVTGYAIGAQTKVNDVTLAAILADKATKLKVSASTKLDDVTVAAAELTAALAGGDEKLVAGASTKLDNGHTLRLVMSSVGSVQCTYAGEVSKGLNATACAQLYTDYRYKYGVQLNYKM